MFNVQKNNVGKQDINTSPKSLLITPSKPSWIEQPINNSAEAEEHSQGHGDAALTETENDFDYLKDDHTWEEKLKQQIVITGIANFDQSKIAEIIQPIMAAFFLNDVKEANATTFPEMASRMCVKNYLEEIKPSVQAKGYSQQQQEAIIRETKAWLFATLIRKMILQADEEKRERTKAERAGFFEEISTSDQYAFLNDLIAAQGDKNICEELIYLFRFQRAVLMASKLIPLNRNKQLFLAIGHRLEGSTGRFYPAGGQASKETKHRLKMIELITDRHAEKRTVKPWPIPVNVNQATHASASSANDSVKVQQNQAFSSTQLENMFNDKQAFQLLVDYDLVDEAREELRHNSDLQKRLVENLEFLKSFREDLEKRITFSRETIKLWINIDSNILGSLMLILDERNKARLDVEQFCYLLEHFIGADSSSSLETIAEQCSILLEEWAVTGGNVVSRKKQKASYPDTSENADSEKAEDLWDDFDNDLLALMNEDEIDSSRMSSSHNPIGPDPSTHVSASSANDS